MKVIVIGLLCTYGTKRNKGTLEEGDRGRRVKREKEARITWQKGNRQFPTLWDRRQDDYTINRTNVQYSED